MNNIKGAYIKNESGEVVSPIVNANTVFDNSGTSLDSLIGGGK